MNCCISPCHASGFSFFYCTDIKNIHIEVVIESRGKMQLVKFPLLEKDFVVSQRTDTSKDFT